MTNEEISVQGAKIVGIWTLIGVSDWVQAASFLAFVLSALALLEWIWKKIARPIAVHFGWLPDITPRRRFKDHDGMRKYEEKLDE